MRNALLLASIIALCSPAIGHEIESGMWGFVGEVNGKPGRGIQIDEQGGNTIIATYFGYRADGSALFLQASGPVENDEFAGVLSEYQNGPILGGDIRSGELRASAGNIRIVFTSSTEGKVTLPGEGEKEIRRLQFEDNAWRFLAFNGASSYGEGAYAHQTSFRFSLSGKAFRLISSIVTPGLSGLGCDYQGIYSISGKGIYSQGDVTCTRESQPPSTSKYKTGLLTVSKSGIFSGDIFAQQPDGSYAMHSSLFGVCTTLVAFGTVRRCFVPQAPE
ncbi:hypothetical protein [Pseudorhodoferax sp.]|uniref:hypothetical protein n=1 Tax=Pseudorhodoferax sp. TaxID=1993553 RepID=UPI002DD64683|nr:hypothetical protein [Pseudorhodoferax sp.]